MGFGFAIASILGSVLGSVIKAKGERDAGKAAQAQATYAAGVARNNKLIADRKAADAIERGKEEAHDRAIKARQLIGRQRVAQAASGQVVDIGSALDLNVDEAEFANQDIDTIRSNAAREAAGFRNQGDNFELEAANFELTGRNQKKAAKTGSLTTLLTGAGVVAGRWYGFKNDGTFT